jgi:hypothetical protein
VRTTKKNLCFDIKAGERVKKRGEREEEKSATLQFLFN